MRISDWSSDVCSSDLYGNDYQSSSTTDYAGKVAASGSTSFGSLVPKVSKQVSSSTSNNVGGAASILVDTASDLQKADKIGVSGSVYATGLSSATATIANGSKVNGNVEAYSHFTNSTSEATTLYNSAGDATENSASYATTLAGGHDNVGFGNKSATGGRAYADGAQTATVHKAGTINRQ